MMAQTTQKEPAPQFPTFSPYIWQDIGIIRRPSRTIHESTTAAQGTRPEVTS
jgi:hypothetical protein